MFDRIKNYLKNTYKKENNTKTKDIFEKINDLFSSLDDDVIRFQIGADIPPNIDVILNTMDSERNRIAKATGFILPPVRFLEDNDIQENSYNVYVNGKLVEEKFIIPNKEHIEEEIVNSINNLYEEHLDEIFSNEMVEKYICEVKNKNSKLSADLCNWLACAEIKYILVDLLKNNKSIKNIVYIFEKIAEKIFIEDLYEKNNVKKISDAVINCM